MRGDNGPVDPLQADVIRFTPTCVGTTSIARLEHRRYTVHPHVRGDNELADQARGLAKGSPPRAWGQPFWNTPNGLLRAVHPHVRGDNEGACDEGAGWGRFTPTCVGTTDALPLNALSHPGSPPRAWGQLGDRKGRNGERAVHPHVRGDNYIPLRQATVDIGSPPRAWGQLYERPAASTALTVHPHVRGDNLYPPQAGDRRHKVHPHVRGDNSYSLRLSTSTFGSPPRAWGQPRMGRELGIHIRFTPTCVGTTLYVVFFPPAHTRCGAGGSDTRVVLFASDDGGRFVAREARPTVV